MTFPTSTPLRANGSARLPFTNYELACAAVAAGVPVFPCNEHTKAPHTAHGFKDATTERASVDIWWSRWPDAAVGVVPGSIGALVIDADVKPKKDGTPRRGVEEWEAIRGDGPAAPTVRTPSGGLHIWYRAPAGYAGNGRGSLHADIDVRCDGGFVCLGTMADGRCYLPEGELDIYAILTDPACDLEAFIPALPTDVAEALSRAPARAEGVTPTSPGLWALLDDKEIELVKSALAALPDEVVGAHDEWIKVGQCIHHWSGGAAEGWAIWDEWSARAANYGETRERWASFSADKPGGVTIGSLFHMAKEAGWIRNMTPEAHEVRLTQPSAPPVNIHVSAGELSTLAGLCEYHLVKRDVAIFERGSVLVRPILSRGKTWNGAQTFTPTLIEVTPAYLRDMLCRHIHFTKTVKRSKEFVDVTIDPPRDIVEIILARRGEWQFRSISGVIAAPTLRPDGSVLDRQGYDVATGLFLALSTQPLEMAENPTRKDAEAAADMLDELLTEFPYIDEPSRAVGMSQIITPTARGCMNVAPGQVNSATTPSTGKSYKVDVAHMIATGMTCPVMNIGKTEEETEKRIGVAGIAGQSFVAFDNIEGEVSGEALCSMLTQDTMDLRILGKSEKIRAHNNFCVSFTGNNVVLKGDIIRRVIVCTMDAKMERPEQRKFKKSPLGLVADNREAYIAACLTIVRAYILAGRPGAELLTPFNGFGQWSSTVRGALVWLGYADPVLTTEGSRDEDPELMKLRSLIAAMQDEGFTSYTTAASPREMFDTAALKGEGSLLNEALAPWTRGNTQNTVALGRWLQSKRNRWIGTASLDSRMRDGVKRWFVEIRA